MSDVQSFIFVNAAFGIIMFSYKSIIFCELKDTRRIKVLLKLKNLQYLMLQSGCVISQRGCVAIHVCSFTLQIFTCITLHTLYWKH